jgi:hypothetical protein
LLAGDVAGIGQKRRPAHVGSRPSGARPTCVARATATAIASAARIDTTHNTSIVTATRTAGVRRTAPGLGLASRAFHHQLDAMAHRTAASTTGKTGIGR